MRVRVRLKKVYTGVRRLRSLSEFAGVWSEFGRSFPEFGRSLPEFATMCTRSSACEQPLGIDRGITYDFFLNR